MSIQKVICLGIGSNSFSTLNTVSFVVRSDKGWILVDCGPDIPRQLQRAGIELSSVLAVVLTHSHMDHTLGFPYFLFGRNVATMPLKKKGGLVPPLRVVSEKDLWTTLDGLFHDLHPGISALNFECNHIDIASPSIYLTDDVSLRTVPTNHSTNSFGLRIEDTSGFSLAYSSDTRPCDSFVEMAKGCQIVIIEGMVPQDAVGFAEATKHSTAKEAGEMANRIGCKQTYIVHLRPMFLDVKRNLESEASDAAGFPVSYPEEGAVIWSR